MKKGNYNWTPRYKVGSMYKSSMAFKAALMATWPSR